MSRTNGNYGSGRKRMGRKKGVRLRLVPAILAITTVIAACGSTGGGANTMALESAPTAGAEEIAYENRDASACV